MSMPDKIWAWEIDHNDFPSGYYSISDGYESKPYIRADLVPEWRPIEEAPHGEDVLLFCPDRGCPTNRARIELSKAVWGSSGDGWSNISRHSWATHFMPLPLPPKEDS